MIMQFHRRHIWILVLTLAVLPQLGHSQVVSPACLEQVRLLLAEYGKVAASDALTIHYHQWQEQSGVAGPKVEHWLWTKGNRLRYENADYGFIQDGQLQIVIDRSSQTIVIQDQAQQDAAQGGEMRAFMNLPIAKQADSIAAIASAIVCEGIGRIRIDLPSQIKGMQQPLKSMLWEFDPLAKRMIRQVCTYYSSEDNPFELRDVYLYDALTQTVADGDLPENGLTLLYAGKSLLPAYAGFQVMDLRNKK